MKNFFSVTLLMLVGIIICACSKQDEPTCVIDGSELIITVTCDKNTINRHIKNTFGKDAINICYRDDGSCLIKLRKECTSIPEEAFRNCDWLTHVCLGQNITIIKKEAFALCDKLIEAYSEGNFMEGIEDYAFRDCPNLSRVVFTPRFIGVSAFSGCNSLVDVRIGYEITEINDRTFFSCTSLTSITIPEAVISIGEMAFHNCKTLSQIILSRNLEEIGRAAFQNCQISNIIIPSKVTKIGDYAFMSCNNLKKVYCEATEPPLIGNNIFANNKDVQIYVPEKVVDNYKSAEGWNDYASFIIGY